jgi:large subunit ribosomal protein L12e
VQRQDVYEVARKMRERSQARHFSGTVTEILGTCVAIGCTVEGQKPAALIAQIKNKELQVPEK